MRNVCTTCGGNGHTVRMVKPRRGDCYTEYPRCDACNGKGSLTEQEAATIAKRAELVNARRVYRDMRVSAGISQMTAGAMAGVHPSAIYGWESFGWTLDDGVEERYIAALTAECDRRAAAKKVTA